MKIIIEVPDDWKDHHAVDWEWFKDNAKEAFKVDSESDLSHTEVDGEPVTLYAVREKL